MLAQQQEVEADVCVISIRFKHKVIYILSTICDSVLGPQRRSTAY